MHSSGFGLRPTSLSIFTITVSRGIYGKRMICLAGPANTSLLIGGKRLLSEAKPALFISCQSSAQIDHKNAEGGVKSSARRINELVYLDTFATSF